MGLNLAQVSFLEWFTPRYNEASSDDYIRQLEMKVGHKININEWSSPTEDDFPRVGSYTAYGVFVICLSYVTQGFNESDLEKDENIELVALRQFQTNLKAAQKDINGKDHFLLTNDSDTLFIPVYFDSPIEIFDDDIASLPSAIKALEEFAKILNFDLNSDMDEEYDDSVGWRPINTVKNIARIIHATFTKDINCCVTFA